LVLIADLKDSKNPTDIRNREYYITKLADVLERIKKLQLGDSYGAKF
jgi:hypothetical protein